MKNKEELVGKIEVSVNKALDACKASKDLPPVGRQIAREKAIAALQAAMEMLTDYKKL